MLDLLLKKVLADAFVFSMNAQFCHWNVVGRNFNSYHDFFGSLYKDVNSSVDLIAELLRQINAIAPASFAQYQSLASIQCYEEVKNDLEIIKDLETDNEKVLLSLYNAYKEAEARGELGVSNILQDRISMHHKHDWMLKAFNK